MSLSHQVVNHPKNNVAGELLEKVILENDLSKLTPVQKVEYVKGICQTVGLNPVTKPIQLMKFQGREVPYFTKDASEQLRKINRVSISKVDTKMHDGGVYVVTAYATTPDGRQDCSTGAIVVSGLKGDALANALMKAETKAKRRVTLSICGLGFIDEMEVDSLPNVQKIDVMQEPIKLVKEEADREEELLLFSQLHHEISTSKTLNELKIIFDRVLKSEIRKHPDLMEEIIKAKDDRKNELTDEIDVDFETGEIK